MKSTIKRLLNQFAGNGPQGVEAFDPLYPETHAFAPNVDQLEGFNGELATAPTDAGDYPATLALLGQPSADSAAGAATPGPPPARRAFSLTDVAIAGVDGVVYCPRRRTAVVETVRQWEKPASAHPLFAAPGFPRAEPLPGITLSLASLGAEGFYHFLVESLPRLALVQPWLARVDHVLAPGSPGAFQEAWLTRAGIPAQKIIWLQGLSHFRCAQLLFTSHLSHDSEPTPWLVQAIRRTARSTITPGGMRHLWISRRDARARHLTWEDTLLAELPNFQRVELAGRTPAEQIALLRAASVVAGPHGAGLTNLVFCAPGAAVIELLPGRPRTVFARLASVAQCRHAWATVDFERPPENLPALAEAIRTFAG